MAKHRHRKRVVPFQSKCLPQETKHNKKRKKVIHSTNHRLCSIFFVFSMTNGARNNQYHPRYNTVIMHHAIFFSPFFNFVLTAKLKNTAGGFNRHFCVVFIGPVLCLILCLWVLFFYVTALYNKSTFWDTLLYSPLRDVISMEASVLACTLRGAINLPFHEWFLPNSDHWMMSSKEQNPYGLKGKGLYRMEVVNSALKVAHEAVHVSYGRIGGGMLRD